MGIKNKLKHMMHYEGDLGNMLSSLAEIIDDMITDSEDRTASGGSADCDRDIDYLRILAGNLEKTHRDYNNRYKGDLREHFDSYDDLAETTSDG
ncbi:hypothetical protein LCGC14_0479740 [marine sediment metagenome]|uniref:Uncharacterized protein n=1 Tax=marine sediment metagenome TaxID=412755 RepID=A0A0F9VII4_9ZZZZ